MVCMSPCAVPIESVMMTVRVTKVVDDRTGKKHFVINEDDRQAAETEFKRPLSGASGRKTGGAGVGAVAGAPAGDARAGVGGPERVVNDRGPNKQRTTSYLRSGPQGRR